jgi:hypothetical protein
VGRSFGCGGTHLHRPSDAENGIGHQSVGRTAAPYWRVNPSFRGHRRETRRKTLNIDSTTTETPSTAQIAFFEEEATMRKTAALVVTAILIAATVAIWVESASVTENRNAAATASTSTTPISPIDLMQRRGKNIPAASYDDPF